MQNTENFQISKGITSIGIALVLLSAIAVYLTSVTTLPLHIPMYVVMFIFAMYHGAMRYGIKLMLLFLGLVTVISWSYETMSILTGFPFGHYHYTERFFGPWVGLVPFTIMPAYFAMGYWSWTIGSILLDKRDGTVKGSELVLIPLISSFVMVMWDLSFDPVTSTVTHSWEWHNGGAYFGVPFVNFLGWFLCVFTFYFIFTLILKFKPSPQTNHKITSKAFWILPALMYITRAIQYVVNAFTKPDIKVTSFDGHEWWTGDIYWSMLLVSMFTMMFITFYTIVKLTRTQNAITA